MNPVAAAEQAIRNADPDLALKQLQDGIRANPADPKLRVFLFQLLSVQGQWDRALNQLNVAAELDASTLAMAQMYREALRCEALRNDVFAGRRSPLVFGMPEQWLALLIESLLTAGQGDATGATALRERAFEEAPATTGTIDGEAFAWIADADMRLGPVCEAVINGKYYFVPFAALAKVNIEEPEDLRDLVWMPAHFEFTNGGEAVGVIPTRYPGSEQDPDPLIRLARKTEWVEVSDGVFHGLGQRVLTTNVSEKPLMNIREIIFSPTSVA
ncbi:type VI secretion system accessory protein TagJ [Niveibacterium sp.]|uniref:type VI secretion system accessory protein TagJ n=1 Tax=Niveibacterium sp. TaxID=2017444 RepID=UPI0035AEB5F8